MRLPIFVKKNVSKYLKDKWEKQMFPIDGRRDRTSNWMLWFKMQNKGFMSTPKWFDVSDQRRRLIQVVDKYEVMRDKKTKEFQFVVTKPYFWINYLNPKDEIDMYMKKIKESLLVGGWKKVSETKFTGKFKLNDLYFEYKRMKRHPQDVLDKRIFPKNYEVFEASINDGDVKITEEQLNAPWNAIRQSFRSIQKRENPEVNPDISILKKYVPFQVQLGAGASIESGVPPLHVYHDIYKVSDRRTNKTILDVRKKDAMNTYLSNPKKFWERASKPYLSILNAEPNGFHNTIKELHKKGCVVGPIITSNYDGIPYLLGFKELFVRKLAASHRSEVQSFHPEAKALLVVGEHADRRFIQRSARSKGLKVIYVDPEGYFVKNKFETYSLESPKNKDILFKMSAGQFAKELNGLIDDL